MPSLIKVACSWCDKIIGVVILEKTFWPSVQLSFYVGEDRNIEHVIDVNDQVNDKDQKHRLMVGHIRRGQFVAILYLRRPLTNRCHRLIENTHS